MTRRIILLMALVTSSVRSECGVYLAPSTIPGAGLGMFAGKDYKKGDQVTYGDVIIPIVDFDWNNGNSKFFWLWDEYTWGHAVQESMRYEAEGDDVSAASPGIGAAVNCLLGLVNVEDTFSKSDTAGLHRSKDPGSGAFTPYHDRGSRARRKISAGAELFISYGENYFTTRERIYGQVPLRTSFIEADRIMYKFHRLQSLILKYYSNSLQSDLWELISGLDSRVTNALPSNLDDVESLLPKGTQYSLEVRSQQSLEWLEEHGLCVDNIRNGQSPIPQAGRGAFATRFIPSGGVVAPVPLIHIPNKTHLTIYDALNSEDGGRNESAPIHQQLLLNYCFGHPDSDVLLSPYGVVVSLINHSPTQANTRIVWSKDMRHPEWLQLPPESMEKDHHNGLVFNVVALRDIEEGEEVLLDYGPDWQAAWDNHVAQWKPPPNSNKYKSAYELNNQLDSLLPTPAEGGCGGDVKLWIHGNYARLEGQKPWSNYIRGEILDRYILPNNETRYRVRTFREEDDDEMTMLTYDIVLWSLPRDAFAFDDLPHTRDHSMPWSFRHYIGIPDDIFPQAWKRNATAE